MPEEKLQQQIQTAAAEEKPHLSASALSTYLMCPRKWKFRYVDKIRGPVGSNLILGKAFHSAIEHTLRARIASGSKADLIPWNDVCEKFHEAMLEEFDSANGEIQYAKDATPESMHALGEEMLKVWYAEIAPTLRPVAVEEKFVVSLGADFPYELMGYIDIIEAGDIIVDNKTSAKRWPENKPHKELQATVYMLAYWLNYGRMAREVRYDIVTKGGKRSGPAAQQLSTTRTETELRWFLGLVEDVVGAIQAEAFPPNPTSFLCTPDYCEYWANCHGK